MVCAAPTVKSARRCRRSTPGGTVPGGRRGRVGARRRGQGRGRAHLRFGIAAGHLEHPRNTVWTTGRRSPRRHSTIMRCSQVEAFDRQHGGSFGWRAGACARHQRPAAAGGDREMDGAQIALERHHGGLHSGVAHRVGPAIERPGIDGAAGENEGQGSEFGERHGAASRQGMVTGHDGAIQRLDPERLGDEPGVARPCSRQTAMSALPSATVSHESGGSKSWMATVISG